MKNIFYFGEKLKKFNVRVLNEREVRAGSGILFVFALISFIQSWNNGDYSMTKIFVIVFLIEFFIRLFINPKYAPVLIFGRIFVSNQKPEYVGAPQKKFAWSIGFGLALLMAINLIIIGSIDPLNFFICIFCLIFLFFETSFGICLGCRMYNIFYKNKAELCPGETCEVHVKEGIQKISKIQIIILVLFIFIIAGIIGMFNSKTNIQNKKINSQINTIYDCKIPNWVKKLGHIDRYKLHHNCK